MWPIVLLAFLLYCSWFVLVKTRKKSTDPPGKNSWKIRPNRLWKFLFVLRSKRASNDRKPPSLENHQRRSDISIFCKSDQKVRRHGHILAWEQERRYSGRKRTAEGDLIFYYIFQNVDLTPLMFSKLWTILGWIIDLPIASPLLFTGANSTATKWVQISIRKLIISSKISGSSLCLWKCLASQ